MSQLRYGPRPVADTTDGKVPNREVAATKIGAWSTSLTATFLTDPGVIAAVLPPPLEPPAEPMVKVSISRVDLGGGRAPFGAGTFAVAARHRDTEGYYPLLMPMTTEQAVIGGRLEEWMALDSADALFRWQAAEGSRERSALGLFNRFSRDIGLHRLGRGTGHLLSYGVNPQPLSEARELPAGFFNADTQQIETLDQSQINEHVRHSWFLDYPGGRHPWEGETIPDHQPGSDRYTWAKAPRYGDKVVQTGPLAELRAADAVQRPQVAQTLQRLFLRSTQG